MIRNFVCGGFLLWSLSFAHSVFAEARLYAVAEGAAVKLQWQPTVWAADQVGFVLKRREVAAEGRITSWVPLSPNVLRPSVDYNRDWSTLGFNSEQSEAIIDHVNDQKLATRSSVPSEKLIQLLQSAKQFPAGDGIMMMRDATHAFAWGFGFIDNNVSRGKVFEYGLFEVHADGNEDDVPAAISRPLTAVDAEMWAATTGLEISPLPSPEVVQIRWRMSLVNAESMAVAYFILERRVEDEEEWSIVRPEVPYRIYKGREARWVVSDNVASQTADKAIRYRLTPVNMFQSRMSSVEHTLPSLIQDPLDSARFGPAQLRGRISKGKLHLSWEQEATQWRGAKLKGFRLRENFAFVSNFPLWASSLRESELGLDQLSPGKEYKLDAVFVDWDELEFSVQSGTVISVESVQQSANN